MLKLVAATGLFFLVIYTFYGCSPKKNYPPGHQSGVLAPCPSSPNCVSSQSMDQAHHVKPIAIPEGNLKDISSVIERVVMTYGGAEIVKNDGSYIHAIFKSKVFRFVDDVEFFIQHEKKMIEIRSASRTGYSDFGVNRKRIENLREIIHGFDEK